MDRAHATARDASHFVCPNTRSCDAQLDADNFRDSVVILVNFMAAKLSAWHRLLSARAPNARLSFLTTDAAALLPRLARRGR
jgi:hypothetical protein